MRKRRGPIAYHVAIRRFWDKVRKTQTCWVWTGSKVKGYGVMMISGRLRYTHQISYGLTKGAVPPGLVIDHLCRNKDCCNPDHLEAVTQAENLRRGNRHLRDQCKWGHPYTGKIDKRGHRKCLQCRGTNAEKTRILYEKQD